MQIVEITGERACGLAERPTPVVANGYVLLKVHVAPMCNEYLAYRDGVYLERNRPDSLGHEMAGEVVEAPPDSPLRPGDRVVALCGYPCGRCEPCQRGYYAHCVRTDDPREVCGSPSGECGFAQYAVKPAGMLVEIPAGMSYEHASMACCGLGPTFGAMERSGVRPGETVLITGLGAVGLGGVINAAHRGARVVCVVRSPYRAGLAEKLGADLVVDPGAGDAHAKIMEFTGGLGVHHAIECSGQAEYQRLAVDAVRRLGSVVFLAEPGELSVHIDNDLVQRGVTLAGSLDINRNDANALLEVIAANAAKLDTFVTHRLPMSRVGEAFEDQMARTCGKAVLYPWRS